MVEFSPADSAPRHILRGAGCVGGTVGGLSIPAQPCRAATAPGLAAPGLAAPGIAALWLGPDEFLLIGAATADIEAAFGAVPHALVDVSHRQHGLHLHGEDAPTLLAGAVPLDLAPAAFPVGMCTRTIFEKTEIVLWRTGETAWHIEVARSFAPYVQALLAAIAAANGVAWRSRPD
jgi:sarcosine oxidase subunit gamma